MLRMFYEATLAPVVDTVVEQADTTVRRTTTFVAESATSAYSVASNASTNLLGWVWSPGANNANADPGVTKQEEYKFKLYHDAINARILIIESEINNHASCQAAATAKNDRATISLLSLSMGNVVKKKSEKVLLEKLLQGGTLGELKKSIERINKEELKTFSFATQSLIGRITMGASEMPVVRPGF